MPNPRYLSREGESTVDLLMRLHKAKKTYFNNLDKFCRDEFVNKEELEKIKSVYLVGSHTSDNKWMDETSDVDFVLVVPDAVPENLLRYKTKVLDKMLCSSERKRDWVDLYFVRQDYQVTDPCWNITSDWNILRLNY